MVHKFTLLLALGAALSGNAPLPLGNPSAKAQCVLSVQETSGRLTIIAADGLAVAQLPIGDRPHEIAVSPSGKTAYVSHFGIADYDNRIGTPGDRVVEFDLRHARRVADFVLPKPALGPHGVKLRPGTSELFVNAEVAGDAMFVFDRLKRGLKRKFPLPKGTHNFIFSADGRSIYSFAGANGVSRIDPSDGRVIAHLDFGSAIRGLFLTRSGTILASAQGEIIELGPDDLGIVRRLAAPRAGQFIYATQLPDGTIVAPSPSDGGVTMFPADGSAARFVPTGKSPILVRQGPDSLIYVSNAEDDHITVLDSTGSVLRTISGLSGPNGLEFGECPLQSRRME